MTDSILIGCGAGFSGDRIDAAQAVVKTLIQRKQKSVLMFEMLAERTLALGQLAKNQNPELGYEPLLEDILTPIIKDCVDHQIPIVSNFGAANPVAAGKLILRIAKAQGIDNLKVAVVQGDDILNSVDLSKLEVWEGDVELAVSAGEPIAANVYLGAKAIADALSQGAQVVVTGRVADPALALGPVMDHFAWDWQDWDKLASATMAGHLLECGSQVTGGYFADPGYKDVPDLANVGFPIAEIFDDGSVIISKADNTGGLVNKSTVTEQLLYEIHDPANYYTPDVILDITQVTLQEIAPNQVRLVGAKGKPKPNTLKSTVSYMGSWFGEGEISYAGANAGHRAKLAADVIKERIRKINSDVQFRIDLIGVASVLDSNDAFLQEQQTLDSVRDVRVRLSLNGADKKDVERLMYEVNALYCCGPAGGGGVRTSVKSSVKTVSYLVPQHLISTDFYFIKES